MTNRQNVSSERGRINILSQLPVLSVSSERFPWQNIAYQTKINMVAYLKGVVQEQVASNFSDPDFLHTLYRAHLIGLDPDKEIIEQGRGDLKSKTISILSQTLSLQDVSQQDSFPVMQLFGAARHLIPQFDPVSTFQENEWINSYIAWQYRNGQKPDLELAVLCSIAFPRAINNRLRLFSETEEFWKDEMLVYGYLQEGIGAYPSFENIYALATQAANMRLFDSERFDREVTVPSDIKEKILSQARQVGVTKSIDLYFALAVLAADNPHISPSSGEIVLSIPSESKVDTIAMPQIRRLS